MGEVDHDVQLLGDFWMLAKLPAVDKGTSRAPNGETARYYLTMELFKQSLEQDLEID